MHAGWGGEAGIKVYPPSKIFEKFVNKNAIKHQKGVPSPKNFYNPYIPSLPLKLGKNLINPPSRISNPVHLWSNLSTTTNHGTLKIVVVVQRLV